MKRDRQSRLALCLDRFRFAEDASASRDQNLLSAVGIHRIGDEAVHRRRQVAVEPVGQHGVDNGAFQNSVPRSGVGNGIRGNGALPPSVDRLAIRDRLRLRSRSRWNRTAH